MKRSRILVNSFSPAEDWRSPIHKDSEWGWSEDLTRTHEEVGGKDHFINVASRQHAVEQLKSWLSVGAQPTILEIGSSSGFLLAELVKGMPRALVIGSDCIRQPLTRLTERLPGVSLVQFDATSCPLSRGSVSAAVLLNVIEHISRDDFAVAELHRILKPGGIAVVEVPAGPELYDFYDAHLRHCRRYRIRDLRRLFEASGFDILDQSHLGFFLYPAFWVVKKFNRRFRGVTARPRETLVREAIRTSETGGRISAMLLRLEAVLRRKIYLPFGIRCVITCRKR